MLEIEVVSGGVAKTLTFMFYVGKVDWGPSGHTLAYGNAVFDQQTEDYVSSQINTINSDGTGHKILKRSGTLGGYYDENPSWSPAGAWLVFDEQHTTSTGAISRTIWKMRGDGSGRVKIANRGSDPDWQPLP